MMKTKRSTLSLREITVMAGVSSKTIRRWVRMGLFPAPLVIGMRKWLWAKQDVEEALRLRGVDREEDG